MCRSRLISQDHQELLSDRRLGCQRNQSCQNYQFAAAYPSRLSIVQDEIEKVKKRRLDREKERADQEEMLNMLQRERGLAEAVELERKEEEFHLEQAKAR